MKVREIMTSPVIGVRPEAALKDVAALLAERGVSGVPVVDDDRRVLGVLSETDIVVAMRGIGADADKAVVRTAAMAMSRPPITVRQDATVAEAASAIADLGVSRLPVVEHEGRLVGIVSRANLVRAFARPDDEIRREIEHEVVPSAFLWCSPGYVQDDVRHGDVVLSGTVESDEVAEALVDAVARVPGVVSVRSNLEVIGSAAPVG
jgi:CBS domain-containing protein